MNDTKALRRAAMRAAFPYTIPIMTGFLFWAWLMAFI